MPSVIYADCYELALNVKCHYAECHYAKCRYAECRGARPKSRTIHGLLTQ